MTTCPSALHRGHIAGTPINLRPLVACLLAAGLAPAFAQTLPTGFNAIAGGVTMSQPGAGTMNISQSTARAIAQWNSFSIGAGGIVNIAQPGAASVLLNRVVGPDASTIAGRLNANGQVFLVNPNGVLFSKGSSVSAGGLVASTLDIGNDKFMGGKQLVFERADGNHASVVNAGSIRASKGGTVALMGETVRNDGDINVASGTIGLVSGRHVAVDFAGDGLTTFRISTDVKATNASTENAAGATLTADGGRVAMLAAGSTPDKWVVNQQGTVQARSLTERNGEIILGGGIGNDLRVAGKLDATGVQGGQKGGSVSVDSGRVLVDDGAVLDAGGSIGGGDIRIHASDIAAVSSSSSMRSDAMVAGDGGKVALFGDMGLRAYGKLSARGGASSGDGGFVETSGGNVDLAGLRVDTSAASGIAGEWYLDPSNITIFNGPAPNPVPVCPGPFVCPVVLGSPFVASSDSKVYGGALLDALATNGTVTVNTGAPGAAGGTITFNPDVAITYDKAPARTLRFEANGNIDAPAGVTIQSTNGPLSVEMAANNAGTTTGGASVNFGGTIATRGGHVNMTAASTTASGIALTGGSITTSGGAVLLDGQGSHQPEVVITLALVAAALANGSEYGVSLDNFRIDSGAGAVTINGRGVTPPISDPQGPGIGGVALMNGSSINTTSGNVSITGSVASSTQPLPGIIIGNSATPAISTQQGNITLSAQSLPTTDAIDIGGQVRSVSGAINVRRPQPDGFITLGAVDGTPGFVVSQGEMDLLAAPKVSFGSDSGTIFGNFGVEVAGPITTTRNLTLQTGPLGAIRINGDVNALTVALDAGAGGSITQTRSISAIALGVSAPSFIGFGGDVTLANPGNRVGILAANVAGSFEFTNASGLVVGTAGYTLPNGTQKQVAGLTAGGSAVLRSDDYLVLSAPIQANDVSLLATSTISQNPTSGVLADRLLATSNNGNVFLTEPSNFVNTVAGSANGRFNYVNAGAFTVGSVASSNPQQTVIGKGVTADLVQLHALGGNLNVDQAVSSTRSAVLESTTGDLNVNAPISSVGGVALLANGSIHQTDAGGIATNTLLARATTGDVDLRAATNRASALAGNAAGRFDYSNGGPLAIDDIGVLLVPAIEVESTVIPAQFVRGSGVTGNAVRVRTGAGDLEVLAPVSAATTALLQASGAGNLRLSAPVGATDIALDGGSIAQTAAGSVTASSGLIAVARSGDVELLAAPNHAMTLAGAAAGRFDYDNNDALIIGPVAVADGQQPVAASGITADAMRVRASSGDLTVERAVTASNNAVLQSIAGKLSLNAPVDPVNLALLANGDITQTSAGGITAGGLLVRSTTGDVNLSAGANHADTLAGSATGRFDYADADQLAIGAVSVLAQPGSLRAEATNPQFETGSGVMGNAVRVRTSGGDLDVNAGVTSASTAILQTGGTGKLALNGPVSATDLSLDGNSIAQSTGGTLRVSNGLLAIARAGDVTLNAAGVSVNTVAGRAAGRFDFANADALTVGAINVADAQQFMSGNGVSATDLDIDAVHGNLLLAASVTATRAADLHAGGSVSQVSASGGLDKAGTGDGNTAKASRSLLAPASAQAITADSLRASSATGDVLLADPANQVNSVAGSAGGRFDFANAGALAVGGVAADAVRVRNFGGDMTLAGNVNSKTSADLITASRLQNTSGSAITGGTWRVWAQTWEGETRGGLAGSGRLPNLYNCNYGGACGVVVPNDNNHFIYAQQPAVTLTAANLRSFVGAVFPPMTYTENGLILGDTGVGIQGSMSTPATRSSPPGRYAISGKFTSEEGYAINFVPGTLSLDFMPQTVPDVLREEPTTYVYDRNIGQAPICLATGELYGDRAAQGRDALAREWSLVRTRPNLLSCVNTEKRNGCADF